MRLRRLQIGLWVAAIAAMIILAGTRWATQGEGVAKNSPAFTPVFTLADEEGRIRTSAEFRGKFLLDFFGFTNCPDVCPTTLSDVAQVMDDLGADAEKVQPLFVSIDPERDRRLGLAAYTAAFHPAILGLAGTETETQAAADSFKIFYERENDAASLDGYSMAHSPGLFLIGPDGEWLRQFTYGTPAPEIRNGVARRNAYHPSAPSRPFVEAKLSTEAGAMFQARNPRKRGSVPSFIKSYADLILNESDLNTK